jgi:hypothetical protein
LRTAPRRIHALTNPFRNFAFEPCDSTLSQADRCGEFAALNFRVKRGTRKTDALFDFGEAEEMSGIFGRCGHSPPTVQQKRKLNSCCRAARHNPSSEGRWPKSYALVCPVTFGPCPSSANIYGRQGIRRSERLRYLETSLKVLIGYVKPPPSLPGKSRLRRTDLR